MKIVLPDMVHRKIMHWVNKSEMEVSGLGKVTTNKEGVFTIVDAMLLPQKNAQAHTDIEGDAVSKAMFELRNSPGDLRFWWHSHVNMSVFWSGQDRETIKACGAGGWCIATVFNKKNETRSAFYSVDGTVLPWGKSELFRDDIATAIEHVAYDTTVWDEEYTKNVTNMVPQYGGWHGERNSQGRWTGGRTVLGASINPLRLNKKERKKLAKIEKQLALTMPVADEPLSMLDADDKKYLQLKGFSADDIEALDREEYFSPIEILSFVERGWSAEEIMWASHNANSSNLSAEQMLADYSPFAKGGI